MELWIRSQDRKELLPINDKLYIILNHSRATLIDEYYICYRSETLGAYETKERALEVLDEIQELDIGNNPNIEVSCYAYSLIKVTYNMPKE